MTVTISVAGGDIAQELCDLLHSLFMMETEFTPDNEKQLAGLMNIINNPDRGEILAAMCDGRVIGMVSLLYTVSTAMGGKAAILEDLIVDEKYRHRGIGSALMKEAKDLAKRRNCLRITLMTDFDNTRAIQFYTGFGFNKSTMIPMRLILS